MPKVKHHFLLFIASLFLLTVSFHVSASSDPKDSVALRLKDLSGKEKVYALLDLNRKYILSGDIDRALAYGKDALDMATVLKDTLSMTKAYLNIGICYKNRFKNDKALEYYLKAFKYSEEINDPLMIASVSGSIGNIYSEIKNYSSARNYLLIAVAKSKEGNEPNRIADALANLGGFYYDLDSLQNALTNFKEACVIYKSIEKKSQVAQMENNMASAYTELLKYDLALENYKSALTSYRELGDSSGVSLCLSNTGNLYNMLNKPKVALPYIERALAMARAVDDKQLIASAYNYLFEGYERQGDYKNAFKYMGKYLNLKDTLYSLDANQNIADMQTKYETDKKETENQLLTQKVDLQDLKANRDRIIIYSTSLLAIVFVILAFFIYRSYRQKHIANEQLAQKNKVIEEKSVIVEEQNKDIKDSIRYAKRIQEAILSPQERFAKLFPDSFILFKPKDIVSGDFYWFDQFGDKALFAAADCTGHGVPGAFMSILGYNLLNQAVNEYALNVPNVILNSVNRGLTKALHQKADGSIVQDGMDIALCSIDPKKNILEYAGAYNPVWVIRDKKLIEFTGDKFPIGEFLGGEEKKFTNHQLQLQKGDSVYVFSDGYADQFGGPKGKKFRYKQMLELMISTNGLAMKEQGKILDRANDEWRGSIEQVDDILIIGVKI